jgi:hypothetical protein
MQEPTWRDVLSYAVTAFQRGDWPAAKYVALALFIALARVFVSWAWARHQQRQRVSVLRHSFARWADGLGQPFWTLSTASQLEAIGRLRGALIGDVELVISLLIGLRVKLEALAPDQQVLQAVDRLTAEWEDRTVAARRRRYRKLRGLASARSEFLERRPEA